MLFITNRCPTEGPSSKEWINASGGREFQFDLDENSPSNSIYFCTREKKSTYREIGSDAFLSELKALCNKSKPNEALVVPVVWPCDNDKGIVQDYWDDQKSADIINESLEIGKPGEHICYASLFHKPIALLEEKSMVINLA